MAQILNEINLGAVAKYNGMTMFRKIALSQAFTPQFEVSEDGESLLPSSKIMVTYNEYIKNSNGEINQPSIFYGDTIVGNTLV